MAMCLILAMASSGSQEWELPVPACRQGTPEPVLPSTCNMRGAMPTPPAVVDATFALLPPLLGMLERIAWAQRHLYPPVAGRLADELARPRGGGPEPVAALEAVAWPADLGFMRDRLAEVTRGTLDLIKAFEQAARAPDDFIGLYRAVRRFSGVQERLYPLAPAL